MEREELEKLITAVKILPLRSTDKILIKIEDHISLETMERLKAMIQPWFPENKVIILPGGMDMEVIRVEQLTPP